MDLEHTVAREQSLPIDADTHESGLVSSCRLDNGVLHNPVNGVVGAAKQHHFDRSTSA